MCAEYLTSWFGRRTCYAMQQDSAAKLVHDCAPTTSKVCGTLCLKNHRSLTLRNSACLFLWLHISAQKLTLLTSSCRPILMLWGHGVTMGQLPGGLGRVMGASTCAVSQTACASYPIMWHGRRGSDKQLVFSIQQYLLTLPWRLAESLGKVSISFLHVNHVNYLTIH